MNLGEMLARNGRVYPDEIALIERNAIEQTRRTITWRELDERANRLANGLIVRGVRKGDKVLHLMLNSINWLEAFLGIIRNPF